VNHVSLIVLSALEFTFHLPAIKDDNFSLNDVSFFPTKLNQVIGWDVVYTQLFSGLFAAAEMKSASRQKDRSSTSI